jgi:hypothetical protein
LRVAARHAGVADQPATIWHGFHAVIVARVYDTCKPLKSWGGELVSEPTVAVEKVLLKAADRLSKSPF